MAGSVGGNFPRKRQRLYELIRYTGANGGTWYPFRHSIIISD
jgi:hypothetical protein